MNTGTKVWSVKMVIMRYSCIFFLKLLISLLVFNNLLIMYNVYNQPDCVQVLLISGGESLEPEERVCKYSAGSSDSNPIFLYSVSSLESSVPPTSVDSHFERFFTRLLIQDVNPIGSRYGECIFNSFKRIRFLILFFLIRSRHKLFWRVYALKVKSLKWAHIECKKKIL